MSLTFRPLHPSFVGRGEPASICAGCTTRPRSRRSARAWTRTRSSSSATSPSPTRSRSRSRSASTGSCTRAPAAPRSARTGSATRRWPTSPTSATTATIMKPRRSPARVRARQPALAHRRLVRRSARPLLDAVCQGRFRPVAGGHRVRRHADRVRHAAAGDEGAARRPARASLGHALALDAGVRVLGGGARAAGGRRCIRSSARCRARAAGRSTSPRTRRGSSTGRCPRDGCCCTI